MKRPGAPPAVDVLAIDGSTRVSSGVERCRLL
jgi:hypothetical protein